MSVSCSASPWEITLPIFVFLLWWSQTLRNVGGRGLWKSSSTSSYSKQGYSHNCMRWTIAIAKSSKQPRTGVSTCCISLVSDTALSVSFQFQHPNFNRKHWATIWVENLSFNLDSIGFTVKMLSFSTSSLPVSKKHSLLAFFQSAGTSSDQCEFS